jgi:hypothetical protein
MLETYFVSSLEIKIKKYVKIKLINLTLLKIECILSSTTNLEGYQQTLIKKVYNICECGFYMAYEYHGGQIEGAQI